VAIWLPRDYQGALRDFKIARPRVNWWAGTGTGKTSAGIYTFDLMRMFGEARHLLVITTKNIATLVWHREVARWENFEHLTCAIAVGTPAERMAALRRKADITTINVDNLPWLVEQMGDDWYWDMVIADESSKLKSLRIALVKHPKSGKQFYRVGGGSKRAGDLARIAHKKVNHWINATGTPMSNGLVDLWGQAWFIDAGQRLGRSFTAFQQRWFRSVRIDSYQSILEPHDHAEAEIKALLNDVTITIEAKDYFDLPPTVINKIKVTLPNLAYVKYREMEKEFFTEVQGNEIEAFNSGSKSMKCRQLASGAAYIEPDDGGDVAQWVEVHDVKIEALKDIVEEAAGEPVLVGYYFKSDLARLKKAFPKAVQFDGKAETLQHFCDGKIRVMFIHPKSAAHGLDGMQQHCRNVVFFSMIWELEDFQQLIERVGATRQVQSGHYRTVFVHLLIGENTIEEDMVDRIDSKASIQDAVKAAMKKRGLQ
jgi:SNF2 family DNA or RNA helicase